MPLSTVDDRVALIVVDLQQGLLGLPTVTPLADAIARTAELAAAFRSRHLPVVLVATDGSPPGRSDVSLRIVDAPAGFADPVDELGVTDTDVRVVKRGWSAFHGTGLDEALAESGVTQVVLTGVATSLGVESTARAAHELGYHVVIVRDAVVDIDADAHASSLRASLPALAEIDDTAAVLDKLGADRG